MNLSKNEKVQNFLDNLQVIDNETFDIVVEVREIIFSTYQEVDEKIMYGGIVFFFNAEMFSGIFVNKNHITLEFSNGFLMKDSASRLEGIGKYRRHLKIRKREDILNKEVAFFVKQAL